MKDGTAERGSTRVNERVRAQEVRLIGLGGEQLGVMSADEARALAADSGYDLVEVAPAARPPVCRIMDYGRYKYEQKKKAAATKAKGKGRAAVMKEVKMRPHTDDHDLHFKLRNARRFLIDGDKVKVTVMFRGRELAHRKNGYAKLERVRELLGELVTVENEPQMTGRFLSMVLVPNRDAALAAKRAEAKSAAETTGESEETPPAGE
ncbi:MAG: translation initiation factor IF-3 [Deltaproteobacteria bacterium]|nr:translation initiation factor IF-3 [Deltaproteobacteria bacterium]